MKLGRTALAGTALAVAAAPIASADGPSAGCAGMLCATTVTVTHGGGGGGGSHSSGGGRAPSGGSGSSASKAPSISFFPGAGSTPSSSGGGGGGGGGSAASGPPAYYGALPLSAPTITTGQTCIGAICIPTPQITQQQSGTVIMPPITIPGTTPAATQTQAQTAAAPAPPPLPTAAQWTQAVRAQMKLTNPKIGSAPCSETGCMGAVGVPVWLWATDLGDKAMNVTLGPYSVSAKASVSKMSFSLGDGRSISCTGKGTPYDTSKGWAESPDCGTKYLKKGTYTVTATATWHVTWTGVNTGDLDIPASSSTTLTIGEYQALTQ